MMWSIQAGGLGEKLPQRCRLLTFQVSCCKTGRIAGQVLVSVESKLIEQHGPIEGNTERVGGNLFVITQNVCIRAESRPLAVGTREGDNGEIDFVNTKRTRYPRRPAELCASVDRLACSSFKP